MFYINDDIRVIMTVNESLVGATVKVCYKQPLQTVTITTSPTLVFIDKNQVVYDLPKANNTTSGIWNFWVRVTDSAGKEASSTNMEVEINKH